MLNRGSESCRIAFKEWASVCDALLEGRQTIILRKGGISEGTAPGLFVPEHSEFWLYPTWVHQAEQGVRKRDRRSCQDSIGECRRFGADPWSGARRADRDSSRVSNPCPRSQSTTSSPRRRSRSGFSIGGRVCGCS